MPSRTNRSSRSRHRWAAVVLLLGLLLPCGGCTFLQDEFTWLDRAAPGTSKAPDAAPSGEVVRP